MRVYCTILQLAWPVVRSVSRHDECKELNQPSCFRILCLVSMVSVRWAIASILSTIFLINSIGIEMHQRSLFSPSNSSADAHNVLQNKWMLSIVVLFGVKKRSKGDQYVQFDKFHEQNLMS